MTRVKVNNGLKNLNEFSFVHVLGVNRDRRFLEIFNPSENGVYINLSGLDGCAPGTGVFIKSGGSWRMDNTCYAGEISAMGTNSVQTITFVEF